jgi:hypothetical protein
MPRLVAGNYRKKRREAARARRLREKQLRELKSEDTVHSVSDTEVSEEESPMTQQTFPTSTRSKVIHQSNDLTCGMRSLQNMYGRHFVTRKEMDEKAVDLEKKAFGVQMYDKKLGYYHVEVLKAILLEKGKFVQRIDADKLPSSYFHPAITSNPLFSGYIVALDNGGVGHYVTIRLSTSGKLRLFDSLPGAKAVRIKEERLFNRDSDDTLLMYDLDTRPVTAILAVGSAPFLEYMLMHDTWSDEPPPVSQYMAAIKFATESWKSKRTLPDNDTYNRFKAMVLDQVSQNMSVVVQYENEQTILQCNDVHELVVQLVDMNWINVHRNFRLEQDGNILSGPDGSAIGLDTHGTFDDYGIDLEKPIRLILFSSDQVQVGGFYQFECNISGRCIGTQHNAYSVRDNDGTVHVVYKSSIENIKQIKR